MAFKPLVTYPLYNKSPSSSAGYHEKYLLYPLTLSITSRSCLGHRICNADFLPFGFLALLMLGPCGNTFVSKLLFTWFTSTQSLRVVSSVTSYRKSYNIPTPLSLLNACHGDFKELFDYTSLNSCFLLKKTASISSCHATS